MSVIVTWHGNVCEEALKGAAMCLESSLGQCDAWTYCYQLVYMCACTYITCMHFVFIQVEQMNVLMEQWDWQETMQMIAVVM